LVTYKKSEKITALERLIQEIELRGSRRMGRIDRSLMPGKKRDLLFLARDYCPELYGMSESSFEEYMSLLRCRFPPPGTHNFPDAYRQLFPEYFRGKIA
jgi:hypothetical protein